VPCGNRQRKQGEFVKARHTCKDNSKRQPQPEKKKSFVREEEERKRRIDNGERA
jgi:hypothetical protein